MGDPSTETNNQPEKIGPELRPYQLDILGQVASQIARGVKRILIPLPTGGGKTVIAASMTAESVRHGKRVLFLAHRRELTQQASAKLFAFGIDSGIIQAGFPSRPGERVQVASVQTLHARAVRTNSIGLPDADIVIVDEAHHCRARTYQALLERYPDAIIIGLTATPCRGDGRGLGNAFEVILKCPDVRTLTKLGFLVPAKIFAPERPNLAGVRIERGDYVESQLAERMDTPQLVGNIIEHWHRLAEKRKTIVFATGVGHSVHIRNEFRRSGVVAEHIDGSTPADERDRILRRLALGEIELVSNCSVLTEGFDSPDVGCIVIARPTKSLGLYRQIGGRGLRPAPGKADVIVLDHAGAVFEHGFLDDPVAWTLKEDRRAKNKAHGERGSAGGPPRVSTCPECLAVRFEGKACTVCGWRPQPKAEDFETAEGNLGEVRADRSVAGASIDKATFHAMLIYIARDRGYRPGWAAYKFKEKFGHWPADRYVIPIPPDDAVRSWVRSRQIAYAKAQEKARSA